MKTLNIRRSFSGVQIGLCDGRPDFGFDLVQAVRADHLANGLLGFEELVDVGLGKTDGLGEV
ncbi:hypothetical protein OKW26_003602 [Paraburkholderia sp. 32]